jgi:hypothetical protein
MGSSLFVDCDLIKTKEIILVSDVWLSEGREESMPILALFILNLALGDY